MLSLLSSLFSLLFCTKKKQRMREKRGQMKESKKERDV